ncbi:MULTISPECIES: 3-hydroxyacyl-CoA dehydrogenase NAD-binding domain-containing protein [unclassified Cupriavidus]|uniref:3-hydroxyacyl-CoA dehydrogenase NAD-binding domain-containing protein n=1 Tax=unclassified Cupriavidus TaxID=2640874 RepID=UPI00105439C6|nr:MULTISPECIES: 3-hydroxyacyl-CoA dehydrogenase NAD-binding domain-containing protein [unclassified Cupriavidus]MBF6989124.1 enoyl-CoA hydratase/isomerase family protein [Cupriavidus sp. IK-TO18]TDF61935.1 3-hydroxyacyl-CoA dehydrogenase [Cupriavidus sp. L7L]
MSTQVRTERVGNVLAIFIDNPPVNAGSLRVRQGILEAIETLSSVPSLEAGVLIGAGNTFIAGSDLREFGKPLERPELPAVIAAIETCEKPVVAALHGAALGGGFELALGCDARVGSRNLVVGLPEVTLGMIPGAGGTQRLPRLIGIPAAIDWVCSGKRVAAEGALKVGVLDEIANGDLLECAVQYARKMGGKRRLRDISVPPADSAAVAIAEAAALRQGKGRPQVAAAIEAVKSSVRLPVDEALKAERAVFTDLRMSNDAFALRHLFFSEREALKHPELRDVEPADIGLVAVIGAGTMGSGIAIAALDGGYRVVLVERDAEALRRGTERIKNHYDTQVEKGKLAQPEAAKRTGALAASLEWTALSQADLVIEAVFEDLAVKREVFAQVDRFAKQGAILASNTSYLDLDAIADSTSRPDDVIGLHFFSPANVMKLVEVVRGKRSSKQAIATGVTVAKRLRKMPVLTGNAFGFIGNRIYAAYRYQCELMLEDGAYPHQIDAALQKFGFAMGPFAVADMSGLDIAWRMRQSRAHLRDPEARYVSIPDRLCEMGRFGRKSGAGYYAYEADGRKVIDPVVHQLIGDARTEKGLSVQAVSDEDIVERVLLSMVNEAAHLLAEGVTDRPSDIDVALANGYGFPRWQGGPVFWARGAGLAALNEKMSRLKLLVGPGFKAADLSPLFTE